MKKSSGIPFGSLPLHVQRQVLAQDKALGPAPKPDLMIRQDQAGLNKTERRFFEWLKPLHPKTTIHAQALTLKLGNGVRYTPDFFAYFEPVDGHRWYAWEVKGFMRDDAAVKIKVAATMFPWIKFVLVWWDRSTCSWKFQEVLPNP